MIPRKRMILLALLISGLLHIGIRRTAATWQTSTGNESQYNGSQYDAEDTTRYRTYVVGDERWMEYQLPQQSTALRLFTNAALVENIHAWPAATNSSDRPGYRYCLAYELVDRRGKTITASEYHFRASAIKTNGLAAHHSFFDKSKLIPAGTRTMQLPLEQLAQPADRIRIRLLSHDASVEEVVTRLYAATVRQDHKDPMAWQRLSHRVREKLTRASVFAPELLSQNERSNLLRQKWAAASPIGLEQRDYAMRRMYVVEDDLQNDSEPGGRFATARKLVVPLPDEPGTLTVKLIEAQDQSPNANVALDGTPTAPALKEHVVRWFGRSAFDRANTRLESSDFPFQFRPSEPGGLLEIASDGMARVFWSSDNQDVPSTTSTLTHADGEIAKESFSADITPSRRPVRYYMASTEQPLNYAISHVATRWTPFRVTLRTQPTNVLSGISSAVEKESASSGTFAMEPASWEFISRNGKVLRRGELTLPATRSEYDYLAMNSQIFSVTDPVSFYFRLPPAVAKVRIASRRGNVLVTAHTRPPQRAARTVVPDDYIPIHRVNSTRKSWFSIRPEGYAERVAGGGSISCHVQSRPPEDKSHITSGEYEWESFLPQNLVASREMLAPRSSNLPTRTEALPSVFVEIPTRNADRDNDATGGFRAQWRGLPNRRWVEPKLVYQVIGHPEGAKRPTVKMTINGKEYFRKQLQAKTGELKLPRFPAAATNKPLLFQCLAPANVRLFVNYLDAAAPSFIKRVTHRIQPSMQFVYPKRSSEQELLLLRVFQRDGSVAKDSNQPLRVHVRIKATADTGDSTGPTASQTITRRMFELPPIKDVGAGGSLAIGAGDKSFDEGQLCYVSLGEDLPAGEYTIHVESNVAASESEASDDSYLMVYRSLPGKKKRKRMLFLEHVDE